MKIAARSTRRGACGMLVALVFSVPSAVAKDLVDVIPNLFGPDGITLAEPTHDAHFGPESLQALDALSSGIASGVNQSAVGSSTSSFTFDVQQAVFVPSNENLGPLLAERADTIGKGKLNFAFTFTRLDYKRFDTDSVDDFEGDSLDDLSTVLGHEDVAGDNAFETDTIGVNLDIDLTQNQFLFFGKYGITDHWEAGFILPVIDTEVRATGVATINRDPNNLAQSNFVHNFCVNGVNPRTLPNGAVLPGPCAPNATSSTIGNRNQTVERDQESHTGFGDLRVATKYNFLYDRPRWPDMAVIGGVRFDTGDEDNFTGSGNTGFNGVLVASKRFGIFEPHLNWGAEVTTDGGDTNFWRLVAGTEVTPFPYLTLSVDVLGLNTFNGEGINDNIWDLGFGAKVNPWSTLTFLGSILIPFNQDEGLRTNLTWTLGVEYTF